MNTAATGCILIVMLLLSAFISLTVLFMTSTEGSFSDDGQSDRQIGRLGSSISQPHKLVASASGLNSAYKKSYTPPSVHREAGGPRQNDQNISAVSSESRQIWKLSQSLSSSEGVKFVGIENAGDMVYMMCSNGSASAYAIGTNGQLSFITHINLGGSPGEKVHRAKLNYGNGRFFIVDGGMRKMSLNAPLEGTGVMNTTEFIGFQAIDAAVSSKNVINVALLAAYRSDRD